MQDTYNQIHALLNSELGQKLNMDAGKITYESDEDPGLPVRGYTTNGVSETINIPDDYMAKAGAGNAAEFLSWLQSQ